MSQQDERLVRCEVDSNGVADVRLDRPEKLNALTPALFAALVDVGAALAADPSVRAVVVSGEGRGFCAGLDFASFVAMTAPDAAADAGTAGGDDGKAGGDARRAGGDARKAGGDDGTREGFTRRLGARTPGAITNLAQQAVWTWREMPVPTIAAVHGVALGGGLQIALGADLRIVAPDARLSVLEVRWGLIPDMCGTHLLPRLVGLERAKELTWTGRMVSGDEAVRIGLASRVADDPRAAALELATDLAGRNPHALRAGKALLDHSLARGAAEQLQAESDAMGALIGSPNQVEAVQAWFAKRPAVFADPPATP